MLCAHSEEYQILIHGTQICELCESEAKAEITGVHFTSPLFQETPTVAHPTISNSEFDEIENVIQLVTTQADAAICDGRRMDALAMNLALQAIRNLSNRVQTRQVPVMTAPMGLRLVAGV